LVLEEEEEGEEKRGSFLFFDLVLSCVQNRLPKKKGKKKNDVILHFGLDKIFGQLGRGQIKYEIFLNRNN
jgi:hypothetical protein